MNAGWRAADLLEPIASDNPCGQNLEDTALLASFDSYRLYGRSVPLDPAPGADSDDGGPKALENRDERPPDWVELKERSLEALHQSKDLRLLAHLSAALLRIDGLAAFTESLSVASQWLEAYWEQTYPPIDGDGILRRNALNCFADPMAVVDRVRRVPLVASRQHGMFSLRDIDLAAGQGTPGRGETRPDEAQINAAFATLPIEELTGLLERVSVAIRGLKSIESRMRSDIGTEAAPDFAPLSTLLVRIERVLKAQLAARPGHAASTDGSEAAVEAAGGAAAERGFSGAVRTRDEAVRALDAVAAFFRTHEPSSPVPLFCERAKGLVSKNFLEVLEDVAPDAVKQARAAGGLKD
jgi:type VI secretion system protein ImpA